MNGFNLRPSRMVVVLVAFLFLMLGMVGGMMAVVVELSKVGRCSLTPGFLQLTPRLLSSVETKM